MASFTERIAVVVDSRVGGAIRGLQTTGRQLDVVGVRTKGAQRAITALDRSGLAASTTLGGRLRTSMAEAGTVAGGLSGAGITLSRTLGVGVPVAAAAGAMALGAFALEGAAKFSTATAEVRKLQRVMGGSAEDASRLRFVAKALGLDLDAVARGAGLMAKSIGNGTSKLTEYGVEIARDSAGNVEMGRTIANVAAAFSATSDPTERAKIGAAAFGRGWQEMIPILGKSRQEIEALYAAAADSGQIFDEGDTERGRRLAAAQREMTLATEGLQIAVGEGLVPALTTLATTMTDVTQSANEMLDVVGLDLGMVAEGALRTSLNMMGMGFLTLGQEEKKSTEETGKAIDAAERQAQAEDHRRQKLAQTRQELAASTDGVIGLVAGTLAYETQLRSMADAQVAFVQAQFAANAAGRQNLELNDAENRALFALRGEVAALAEADRQRAIQEAGPNVEASRLAMIGYNAYRESLARAAQSEIPATRDQAQQLLTTMQGFDGKLYKASVEIDTAGAIRSLADLRGAVNVTRDAVGSAFGAALEAVGERR